MEQLIIVRKWEGNNLRRTIFAVHCSIDKVKLNCEHKVHTL